MTAQWKGPFRIVEQVNDVNYRVNVGGRRGIVTYHINLLKKHNRGIMFVNSVTKKTINLSWNKFFQITNPKRCKTLLLTTNSPLYKNHS